MTPTNKTDYAESISSKAWAFDEMTLGQRAETLSRIIAIIARRTGADPRSKTRAAARNAARMILCHILADGLLMTTGQIAEEISFEGGDRRNTRQMINRCRRLFSDARKYDPSFRQTALTTFQDLYRDSAVGWLFDRRMDTPEARQVTRELAGRIIAKKKAEETAAFVRRLRNAERDEEKEKNIHG